MSTAEIVVEQAGDVRLMVLSPLSVDAATLNLAGASRELEAHIEHSSDGLSRLWGYFPELDPDPMGYPECLRLAKDLAAQALPSAAGAAGEAALSLAFIRLATGEPSSPVGGMHIDVHSGVGHRWPRDVPQDWHVLRLLLNLGTAPRRLEYCPLTVGELRERHGIELSRSVHQPVELPADVPLRHVEIPRAGDGTLWCLRFVSSLLPHAGRTDGRGHFLAGYGGYVPPGLLPMI